MPAGAEPQRPVGVTHLLGSQPVDHRPLVHPEAAEVRRPVGGGPQQDAGLAHQPPAGHDVVLRHRGHPVPGHVARQGLVLGGVTQSHAVPGVPAQQRGGPLGVVGEQEVLDRVRLTLTAALQVGIGPLRDPLAVRHGPGLPLVGVQDTQRGQGSHATTVIGATVLAAMAQTAPMGRAWEDAAARRRAAALVDLGPIAQLRAGRLGRRVPQLLLGLALYGISLAFMVRSGLGVAPWDVLHQGLTIHLPMSLGQAIIVMSFVVLLLWLPLREQPGVGTVANALLVGVAADVTLAVLAPPDEIGWRIVLMLVGVVGNAFATALYIGAQLGRGPRDGLMTGLSRRTGRSLRLVRTLLEVTVVALGTLLGGTLGVGTVLYALTIGPLAQLMLPACLVDLPGREQPWRVPLRLTGGLHRAGRLGGCESPGSPRETTHGSASSPATSTSTASWPPTRWSPCSRATRSTPGSTRPASSWRWPTYGCWRR